MLYGILILAVLLGGSLYLNWNLSRKVTILERYAGEFLTDLYDLRARTAAAYKVIKDADLKGAFESDDEVGSAFKIIKQAIESMHDIELDDTSESGD